MAPLARQYAVALELVLALEDVYREECSSDEHAEALFDRAHYLISKQRDLREIGKIVLALCDLLEVI